MFLFGGLKGVILKDLRTKLAEMADKLTKGSLKKATAQFRHCRLPAPLFFASLKRAWFVFRLPIVRENSPL